MKRRSLLAGAAVLGLAGCGSNESEVFEPASAQSSSQAAANTASQLFVLNSTAGTLAGDQLILTGVGQEVVVFADRPRRTSSRVSTSQFLASWSAYGFVSNPPNAVLQVGVGPTAASFVVELLDPRTNGSDVVTFRVRADQSALPLAPFGASALFIDNAAGQERKTLTFEATTNGSSVGLEITGIGGFVRFSELYINDSGVGPLELGPLVFSITAPSQVTFTLTFLGSSTLTEVLLVQLGDNVAPVSFRSQNGSTGVVTPQGTKVPWASFDPLSQVPFHTA